MNMYLRLGSVFVVNKTLLSIKTSVVNYSVVTAVNEGVWFLWRRGQSAIYKLLTSYDVQHIPVTYCYLLVHPRNNRPPNQLINHHGNIN